jgi:bifunctional NMN adenylyltransferase/nudix hydrolase
MSVGVIVGRFQSSTLHEGHKFLIDKVFKKHQNRLVVVGCNEGPQNDRYPLRYQAIRQMLMEYTGFCEYAPILDRQSNEAWSNELDNIITSHFPMQSITLYCSRDGFDRFYSGRFKCEVLTPDEPFEESGTTARQKIADHFRIDSCGPRAAVIKTILNAPPITYMTVDIACIDHHGQVLLGRKPGEKAFRFPGGFLDFTDSSLEAAAKRELYEETKLSDGELSYIGSFPILDFRNTPRSRIMTAFFEMKNAIGLPIPSDDLEELRYFSLSDSKNIPIQYPHIILLTELLKKKGINR